MARLGKEESKIIRDFSLDLLIVTHQCQTCQRNYYVYRKPEQKDRGVVKCCSCRHGGGEETFMTKALFRWAG